MMPQTKLRVSAPFFLVEDGFAINLDQITWVMVEKDDSLSVGLTNNSPRGTPAITIREEKTKAALLEILDGRKKGLRSEKGNAPKRE